MEQCQELWNQAARHRAQLWRLGREATGWRNRSVYFAQMINDYARERLQLLHQLEQAELTPEEK